MIELVIKIPEEKYKAITEMYDTFPKDMKEWGLEAIKNGTPLPKGHGRLIDADALFHNNFPKADIQDDEFDNLTKYPYWKTDITGLQTILKNAPTIIEGSENE